MLFRSFQSRRLCRRLCRTSGAPYSVRAPFFWKLKPVSFKCGIHLQLELNAFFIFWFVGIPNGCIQKLHRSYARVVLGEVKVRIQMFAMSILIMLVATTTIGTRVPPGARVLIATKHRCRIGDLRYSACSFYRDRSRR